MDIASGILVALVSGIQLNILNGMTRRLLQEVAMLRDELSRRPPLLSRVRSDCPGCHPRAVPLPGD